MLQMDGNALSVIHSAIQMDGHVLSVSHPTIQMDGHVLSVSHSTIQMGGNVVQSFIQQSRWMEMWFSQSFNNPDGWKCAVSQSFNNPDGWKCGSVIHSTIQMDGNVVQSLIQQSRWMDMCCQSVIQQSRWVDMWFSHSSNNPDG
jgi:hypothetical protein